MTGMETNWRTQDGRKAIIARARKLFEDNYPFQGWDDDQRDYFVIRAAIEFAAEHDASRADGEQSSAKEKAAFNHGYLLACCNIVNLHDRPEIAFDILQELGVSKAEVKAMQLCDYDKKALKEIEQARGNTDLYRADAEPAPVPREVPAKDADRT